MQHGRRWRGWLGGLGMLAVCVVPFVLLIVSAHRMSVTVVGTRHSGWSFDYGFLLSQMPGAVAIALLAPFVGYRRRDALWFLFPPVNIYFAWVIGFLAAERGAPPEREAAQARPCSRRRKPPGTPVSPAGRRAEDLIREGLKR